MPEDDPQNRDIEALKVKNRFTKLQFSSARNRLLANLYLPDAAQDQIPGVFFIHGGGMRGKSTFKNPQRDLVRQGFGSFAYDSSGFGGSEGERSDETLDSRLEDASAALGVFMQYVNTDRISLVGVSMGADIAISLLAGQSNARKLILLAPAVYPEASRTEPINLGFSRRLRRDEASWQDAPAFSRLEAYPGQVLIAYGSNDNIIPQSMQEKFRAIAESKNWQFLTLNGAPHNLLRPHNEVEKQAKQSILSEAAKFLAS